MMREELRKFLQWLKRPHGWGIAAVVLLFLGVLAATIALIVFSPQGKVFEVLAYILYGFSAVLLGYLVYIAVRAVRSFYATLSEKHAFLGRMHEDYTYRTLIFAIGSGLFAAGVAAYYFTLFGLSFSLWFLTLASYYAMLAATRGGMLLSRRQALKNGEGIEKIKLRDAKGYLGSGAMLVLLASAFATMLVFTVRQGFHREYVGLTIYVAALYATLKVVFAVINLVKARRRADLTVRTLRNVNIADALVSVVALQAAMLQQFLGEGDPLDASLFNSVTGGIVLVVIVAMGIHMIVQGEKRLTVLKAGHIEEAEAEDEAELD